MGNESKPERTLEKLVQNYEGLEQSLVSQLTLETPNHPYTTGSYRETVWQELFERIIPKKYRIEQGVFIMDSFGQISKEVDLAVFDEMYTPYIFNYGKIMFIPIEAVAVVVQCKSKIGDSAEKVEEIAAKRKAGQPVESKTIYHNLIEWVDSIKKLKTSPDSVARTITNLVDNLWQTPVLKLAQTATRPINILCATAINDFECEKLKEEFDILLYVKGKKLKKVIGEENTSFDQWYDKLNHYGYDRYKEDNKYIQKGYTSYQDYFTQIKKDVSDNKNLKDRTLTQLRVTDSNGGDGGECGRENVIMSLTFQLNQLLMLLNNPMLFPHRAYADCFSRIMKEMKKKKK